MLPNTFIAGAQKSGTTTLCSALACHPHAVVSQPKEPIFFSRAANLTRPEIYEGCFQKKRGNDPRIVIDGSNAYMADPAAASRIREMLGGELRFIFSLRDPLQRMVSGYWHQAKKGNERRTLDEVLTVESNSLADAVQEEENRLQYAAARGLINSHPYTDRHDDPLWNFRYIRNSLYAGDLARFHETFAPENTKVLLFDDLVSDPLGTLGSVAAFLGLDPTAFPDNPALHLNPTQLSRAPRLLNVLRRLPGRLALREIPGYETISRTLFYRRPGDVPGHFIRRWRRLFAPEVARLETMLGRQLAMLWE